MHDRIQFTWAGVQSCCLFCRVGTHSERLSALTLAWATRSVPFRLGSPPLKNLVPSLPFSLPIFLTFTQLGACVKDTKKITTTPILGCC